MANIKKSFNFRNGVQVDDDNLKVSATGLVGIGTTVPTEALDVRGNAVVSGVTSAVTLQAGVATITTLNPTEIIGAGVSIKSGIVTASSGIITYFGDGINLLNLPTSQWEDTIVGAGVSSIYNTGGNVGIATTAALFTLQVGNDVNSGQKGVGISSFGDIKASGITTASGFVGPLTGDVTGNVTGNLTGLVNSSGISTFAGINATGRIVGAATSNVIPFLYGSLSDLPSASTYHGAFAHVHATGKGYFAHAGQWWELVSKESNGVIGNGSDELNIKELETDQINVTGVSTFVGNVIVGSASTLSSNGIVVGNNKDLKIGAGLTIASNTNGTLVTFFNNTEVQHILEPNVTSEVWTSEIQIPAGNFFVPQLKILRNTGVELYYENGGIKFATSGVGATVYGQLDTTNIIASSTITAAEQLNTPICGIGTDAPAHDIQVRKTGDTEIQVTSDTGSAGITVGREAGSGKTNNAEFRYGFSAGSDYNTPQSLDIINYGTDNFNYYLSANNPGGVTGNYYWHKGLNNVRLMTLTNTGRLGIGITAPTDELDVQGGITVSGNITVGNNVTVTGNIIGNVQGSLTGNVAGTLAGNTNTTVGISTLNNLSIAGIATAARLRANKFAIGENPSLDLLSIFISNTNKVFVNDVGQVGISTTIALPGVGVNGSSTNAVFNSIGIGITQFTSAAVDLRDAGTATSRYMMPPKVNTSQRASLVGVESGAVIYNTSLNKLQVYVGSGAYNVANWQNLH